MLHDKYFLVCNKNIRFDFDDELKIGDVRYDNMTKIIIQSTTLLTFIMSNGNFPKK